MFDLKFSRFAFSLKLFQYWIAKLVWSRIDWFCGFFCWIVPRVFVVIAAGTKLTGTAQVWLCFDDMKSFRFLVCGVFFKCECTFLPKIFLMSSVELFQSKASLLPLFLVFQPFFKKWWQNVSSVASENHFVRFPLLLEMLTVFGYFTPLSALFKFWSLIMEPYYAPARCWPGWFRKCVSSLRRLEKTRTFGYA